MGNHCYRVRALWHGASRSREGNEFPSISLIDVLPGAKSMVWDAFSRSRLLSSTCPHPNDDHNENRDRREHEATG